MSKSFIEDNSRYSYSSQLPPKAAPTYGVNQTYQSASNYPVKAIEDKGRGRLDFVEKTRAPTFQDPE